jgi:2-C-methyl-D-erythritol 4-phosphate cytidylyltransferase
VPVAGIIPAAGRGERLGGPVPKALRVLRGRPLVWYAVQALAQGVDRVDPAALVEVVVAAPREHVGAMTDLLVDAPVTTRVIAGGATRQASVAAALAALPATVDRVLVHDAARPLVPASVVAAVVAALADGDVGVVPGVPVVDTIKQVDATERVVATVDRSVLRAVQTPQGFARAVLAEAHRAALAAAVVDAGDDAALLERLGHPVRVVPGHEEAFKVTRPRDLALAELLLGQGRR